MKQSEIQKAIEDRKFLHVRRAKCIFMPASIDTKNETVTGQKFIKGRAVSAAYPLNAPWEIPTTEAMALHAPTSNDQQNPGGLFDSKTPPPYNHGRFATNN